MVAACFTLYAAEFSFLDKRVLAVTASLAAALILGALVLALVDRWRKKQENVTLSVQGELASYRELYQSGELSAEEFERLKTRLVTRLKTKPKPEFIIDPETGQRIPIKNPTPPVVPPLPKLTDEPPATPSPPPDSASSGPAEG